MDPVYIDRGTKGQIFLARLKENAQVYFESKDELDKYITSWYQSLTDFRRNQLLLMSADYTARALAFQSIYGPRDIEKSWKSMVSKNQLFFKDLKIISSDKEVEKNEKYRKHGKLLKYIRFVLEDKRD